jgi:hypothetical protein
LAKELKNTGISSALVHLYICSYSQDALADLKFTLFVGSFTRESKLDYPSFLLHASAHLSRTNLAI